MPKPLKKIKARSRDVNEAAYAVVARFSADDEPAPITPDQLSAYMKALGRKGGKASGAKRLQNLSDSQRSEIALRAATARWDKERAKKKRAK